MIDKIKQLEKVARHLEPDIPVRQQWNAAVQAYADDFLNNIQNLNAFDYSEDQAAELLDIPVGQQQPMEEILQQLQLYVDRTGINPASGKHFGYIPGGGIYPAALGDYLAAVTNRYAGIFFANPGAVRIENQLLRWLCQIIGYPETALGNLTSGGSIANLIAITTARDFKAIKARDIEKCVIYLTRQVHHCVQKAIRIAGLTEATIRYVDMDERFKMDTSHLATLLQQDKAAGLLPFMVVGSAGTTDTGSVDPLGEIADLAEQYQLWFHVDAAYGGFFVLADVENDDGGSVKETLKGIQRSDSLAIDPHKGLFIPYGSGAILIKNVEAQFQTHHYLANYMQDAFSANEELSSADLSPELTKHFRGLRMWLPLQLFGIEPFKAALEEKIWLTRYFYKRIQEIGFEAGPFPELSVVIYRYVPKDQDANAYNAALVQHIQQDGRTFVSSTNIDGVFWIRLAVLSFRAHLKEVDLLLKILKEYVQ